MFESLIPIGASLISGLFGKAGQDSANETNVQLARENRDFQERMSSTAYQRAVADMKAADLNPMLAYSQGGASTPIGQMPQVQSSVGAGFSSAAAGAGVISQVQSIAQSKAQTDQIVAQTRKIESETMEREANARRLAVETEMLYQGGNERSQRVLNLASDTELKNLAVKRDTESFASDVVRRKAESLLADAKSAREQLGKFRDEATFGSDIARRKAESALTQLDVPRAQAEEEFYQSLGKSSPYLRWVLEFLRGAASARRSFGN